MQTTDNIILFKQRMCMLYTTGVRHQDRFHCSNYNDNITKNVSEIVGKLYIYCNKAKISITILSK